MKEEKSLLQTYVWLFIDWVKTFLYFIPIIIKRTPEICADLYTYHKHWLGVQVGIRKERALKRKTKVY